MPRNFSELKSGGTISMLSPTLKSGGTRPPCPPPIDACGCTKQHVHNYPNNVCVSVRACVCACVRACVRACVCVIEKVSAHTNAFLLTRKHIQNSAFGRNVACFLFSGNTRRRSCSD